MNTPISETELRQQLLAGDENYRKLARSRRFVRIDGSRSAREVTRDALALIDLRLRVGRR